MIESILSSILQADEFNEHSALQAIGKYPELLNTQNWQAMNDWKNNQHGENFNRAILLLKQVSKISRQRDEGSKQKNEIEEQLRNISRNHINVAGGFLDADDFPNVTKEYLEALYIDIKIKDHARVRDVLEKLLDLIPDLDLNSAHAIVGKLSGNAYELEAFHSNVLNKLILHLYKGILRIYMKNQPINPAALLLLMQHAKGFAYGAMLKMPTELMDPWSYGVQLLQKIQELEEQPSVENETEKVSAINEEMLLAAYLGEKEKQVEDNREAKINNLQIDFDRWLKLYMLRDIEKGNYPILQLKDIQAALDNDTVLYIQFLAGDANGNAANYILLVSKEEVVANYGVAMNIPAGDVEISSEGMVTNTSILSFSVPDVRTEILDEPYGYEVCTEKGIQLLATDAEMLLGPVASYLEEFKLVGKTKLMIQPHGAYHYYPFQLLPYKDGLLCDEWLVTTLPNLHLLAEYKNKSNTNIKFTEIASFGLGYAATSEFNIPPLINAIAEADTIAKLFNYNAFTDEKRNATQNNFMEALTVAKRVHLCSHGLHDVSAPSFQSLYLMSSKNNNGVMQAWELMGLRAENVDLLTLSACETALGRFDEMDNLQGLPAAFLKAGVSTIIGTLWEAETFSCEAFFVSLYTAITEGKSKSESFQIAQRYARESHPEYRDWGCFFYLGAVD